MRVQWLSMTACAWVLLSACGARSRTIDSDADRIPDADDTGPDDGDGPLDADVDGLRDADIDDDGVPCVPGCDGGPCGPGEWVTICAGSFMMGSPPDEPGRDDEAETQHLVTLTHDFVILSTEVTQREFEEVMGYNPSYDTSCGLDCPVDGWVDWNVAEAYCNTLSDTEGLERCYEGCEYNEHDGTVYWSCQYRMDLDSVYHCEGYRLPTEAEWEFAARAGTTTATYNGDIDVDPDTCEPSVVLDPIAWWCGNTKFVERVSHSC